jgi:ATP-dependent helicase HrpB
VSGPTLSPLPIDVVVPDVLSELAAHGAVVVRAPPGAGKTTRIPPALVEARGKVVVLEPRRLAARLSARRVAEERGERLGQRIGYEVRFERSTSAATRLEFITEGILLRRLVANPTLEDVAAVVLDEFHERHLQADVALALLARLRRTARPDLKLVVMSATLDAAPIAERIGAKVVTSAGRLFDVDVQFAPSTDDRPLEVRVTSALRDLFARGVRRDVLVFLPGAAEIRRAMERAEPLAAERDLLLLPLHGDLSPDAQERALRPADRQKVIFSTNVAETSVTIEGVEAVVDSGLARVATYDPWSGRPGLSVNRISRASAVQRAGRAGRLGPGIVMRLYTKGDHDSRAEFDEPEILRADLAETALMLRASGIDAPSELAWLDPPKEAAWRGADQLLFRLGALDAAGRLTDTGRKMARVGASPRLGKLMIDSAARGAPWQGCLAAAMLSEGRDIYARGWEDAPKRAGADASSDILVRIADLDEAIDASTARRLGLDAGAVQWVRRGAEQWLRALGGEKDFVEYEEPIRRSLLAAFPDRVARRQKGAKAESRLGLSRELLLSTGGTALLAESSVVASATWMVAVEAGDRSDASVRSVRERSRTRVFMASAIEPDWLIELFPGSVEENVAVAWSAEHQRVEATVRLTYDRLVLDEQPAGPEADAAAADLLADQAFAAGIGSFLPEGFYEGLRDRLALMTREAPDLAARHGFVPLDEALLRAALRGELAGRRSFAELRDGSWLDAVRATIGHAKLARLDDIAPEQIALPGGRRLKVHYEPDRAPWVESRLQDFFGSVDTPRILEGRVALVLHLLAPGGKDVQVTTDLAGFWSRTYPSVRNELMRHYPRHSWPDDPRTAIPTGPGRKLRP